MALQFSDTLRNAMLGANSALTEVWNAILSGGSSGTATQFWIYSGSPPANCAAAATGTGLWAYADIPGDPTPFSVASSGAISLPGAPFSTFAGAGGIAGYFRLYDSTPTCHVQGTCGIGGSGADLIFNSTTIVSGQTIQITGFTITAPGA